MVYEAVYFDEKNGKEVYVGEVDDVKDDVEMLAKYLQTYYGTKIGYYFDGDKIVYYNAQAQKNRKAKIKKWLEDLRKTVRETV